ncbi:phosphate acetyltransferase [Subtercola boreus]|uniref:Phosphate acetyltransferase n=1 Tax=Subtercola boreus TaxID=120213 RepID=A0A3E0WFH5_9MICO|nr:phosphate acetyltransferase [Subtercola boreus]RFA22504.1 phosphate acetyltransferase [Subtercola boreus]RFA23274.1 phosphate acetyltransferase [Subtercola boreus]RFA29082.1 phosphate acetyltransferase [Subtercola boreus]
MARSIYITSAEGHSGKSTIALGVLDILGRNVGRVGVFRPIARSVSERDYVLEMLLARDGIDLDYDSAIGVSYEDVHTNADAALSRIVERYKAVERLCDSVVILGSDYTDVGSPTELSFNARIAANLGAPVLLVLGGRAGQGATEMLGHSDARTPDDMRQITELALVELKAAHATLLGIVANRSDPENLEKIRDSIARATGDALPGLSVAKPTGELRSRIPIWSIPEDRLLVAPSMSNLLESTGGTMVKGDPRLLAREALGVVVAGMSMVNVLPRLMEGAVVVIPGDRSEVLLAALMANASATFPSLSGIILNGGFDLPEPIERLIDGLETTLPIISTPLGTYDTAVRITSTRGRLAADSQRKYDSALALFEQYVDGARLLELLDVSSSAVVTPLMFEYGLIDRARAAQRHIVLPEGTDDRVLRAAATVLTRGIARLTLLGEEDEIRSRATTLGIDLDAAAIVSPFDPELRELFAEQYASIRAHRGITLDMARDTVSDVSYFGTMMVHLGLADGMVSGAAHTTAHTIRPAFEIIKTRPDVSVVSSVFLMALADRVLVYGDCAVIPDPTSTQLADIAISSSETAVQFGIDPRVAMLSYSTGVSGSGADVEKVREATAFVRSRRPDLLVEGPIQYDAAADAAVAAAKMPESDVAGRATVFIFPDLNTGNNTYKAVQRSAGAVAVGPVLQGLNKPINDLSRGALVQDIVNTIAITAIQAATSQETDAPAQPVQEAAAAGASESVRDAAADAGAGVSR